MGKQLAKEFYTDGDIVIPVPDSGVPAALGYSEHSKIPFDLGIIRNHYVGRTFIEPTQKIRQLGIKLKHNTNKKLIKGKKVILVDDSIVRGTTSKQIIEMVREAGEKKVLFASAAPPVKFQNLYGIDMAATKELVAHNKSESEIAEIIGADELIYQTLNDLISSVQEGNPEIKEFETSIFTGKYPTEIDDGYLENLEEERSDIVKMSKTKN